jgi:hypothetical protein
MFKLSTELVSNHPWILVIVVLSVLAVIYREVMSIRKDLTQIALKHIDSASLILKLTFNTTNKKQIYLTEQLFRSTYKHPFNYEEISSLLECQRPSKAIQQYLVGNKFLEFSINNKAFVERQGPWHSILGKSPAYTGIVIYIRYIIFTMSGAMLGISTISFITSRYLEGNSTIDEFFVLAMTLLAASLGLIAFGLKDLNQVGNKTIADEFLKENYPQNNV